MATKPQGPALPSVGAIPALQGQGMYRWIIQRVQSIVNSIQSLVTELASLTAQVNAIPTPIAPGGRLTFIQGNPLPSAGDAEGVSAVYYSPYIHAYVPIWNGSTFVMMQLPVGGLTNSYTDATYNPAAVAGWNCYDMFIWNRAGTLTLTRGPAWGGTSGASRPALGYVGSQNGFQTNSAAITNGPAAGFGTYVGTIATYGGVSYWRLGGNYGSANSGADALAHLWNLYNRIPVAITVGTAGAAGVFTPSSTANLNGWYSYGLRIWLCAGDVVPFTASYSTNAQVVDALAFAIGASPTSSPDPGVMGTHMGITNGVGAGAWMPVGGSWTTTPGQTLISPEASSASSTIEYFWLPPTVAIDL